MVHGSQTFAMDTHCYMKKRYVSLLESGKFSDCCFLVDDEKIQSHKIILALSSPVFEAMLFGPLAAAEIVIDDCDASDFRQMLAFIYTDDMQIYSVINAWQLIYIAKKYMIDDLLDYCVQYIRKELEVANILMNLEFADLFNVEGMRTLCMDALRMYAKVILNWDYHMKPTTLCNLLDQNECNASEEFLVCTALKWAYTECQRNKLDATKHNVRAVLKKSGALSRLRFLSIPPGDLVNNKLFTEILNDDELAVLQSCQLSASLEETSKLQCLNLCANANHRDTIPLREKLGYRRVLKSGNVFHANGHSKLTTQMAVNKCVLVNGFLLPTRRAPETSLSSNYIENLNITVTDVFRKKVLEMSYVQTVTYGTLNTVKIAEPFLFEQGHKYDIDISWSTGYLQWANEYSMHYLAPSVINKDVQFEFSDPFDCGFIQGVSYCPI
ncbi:uncharacterized protein CBL_06820 [Carabus blaptoides fortunei]